MQSVAATEPELLAALHDAARRCGRRKRSRPDVVAFRLREGELLLDLARRISDGSYRRSPGRVFTTDRPKHREIHAADYPDRVIHHLLHGLLEPHLEPRFSPASFARRPGRGTHAAARSLQQHVWDVTRHANVRAYALQLDIRSFFPTIHKPTLLAALARCVQSLPPLGRSPVALIPWLLTQRIVQHDATRARRIGPASSFARVPPHKRLGAHGPDCGLPIGNLTSQFFANLYLDALEKFVTRGLGCRRYVRYVDDFVLLDCDPARLVAWREQIVAFLRTRLGLEVHPNVEPVACSRGVDFVGYVIRPRYSLPRQRVVDAFDRKVYALEGSQPRLRVASARRVRLPGLGWVSGPLRALVLREAHTERLRSVWSSYSGHLVHAAAHRLLARRWQGHALARRLLRPHAAGAAARMPTLRPSPSLSAQKKQLARGLSGAVLVMRLGRYAAVQRWVGRRYGLRRRVHRYGANYGVNWPRAAALVSRLLASGERVAVALERPESHGNVKRRVLRYWIEPLGPLRRMRG